VLTAQGIPSPTPSATAPPESSVEIVPADPDSPSEAHDPAVEPSSPVEAQVVPAAGATIPSASRVAGADRFATSIAASQAAFPAGASTVLISSGYAFPDAVVAAGLAAALGAPLLYVQPTVAGAAVLDELRRLGSRTAVVIGGPAVVSDAVLDQLRAVVPDVQRFGGADRYATSRLALSLLGATVDTIYVSGGAGLVDPPLGSVAAARTGRGALLVDGLAGAVDAATVESIRSAGAGSVVIVGGLGTVGSSYEQSLRNAGLAVTRIVTADRFEQSIRMSDEADGPQRAIVANPAATPDVAVAAALAAVTRQPLYYAVQPCMPDATAAHISAAGIAVTGVGGPVWLGEPVTANSSCTTERLTSQSRLDTAIRATLSQYTGDFSVSVREWGGLNATTIIAGGAQREPASMMKIFAAWATLKRIESGAAGFGTMLPSGVNLETCLFVMIHASDNYCHSDIVHWIGIAELNRMIRAAGFPNTFYGTVPYGASVLYAGNRSTTNDLVGMLEKLTAGTVLSRPYADHLLSLMRGQIFRSRIPSGIPPGVVQASKPGALWLASGLLQADTAIVYSPAATYMISIIGDDGPPQAALRAISRTVYEHFNGPFGAAMAYPAQQMVTVRATALRTSPGGTMTVVVPAGTPIQVNDANRIWYKVPWGSGELWALVHDLRNR
jgi:hypothetical protein